MEISNPFRLGKEIQERWKNLRTCFKWELNAQKECGIWRRKDKTA